jgi:hypothetical protein
MISHRDTERFGSEGDGNSTAEQVRFSLGSCAPLAVRAENGATNSERGGEL